jgi:hypothetical protein
MLTVILNHGKVVKITITDASRTKLLKYLAMLQKRLHKADEFFENPFVSDEEKRKYSGLFNDVKEEIETVNEILMRI